MVYRRHYRMGRLATGKLETIKWFPKIQERSDPQAKALG